MLACYIFVTLSCATPNAGLRDHKLSKVKNLAISKVNNQKTIETNHFLIYTDKYSKGIKDIIEILEKNYPRLTSFYKVPFENKIPVKIYPDLESFHKASKRLNAPDWFVGTARYGKKIMMVTPGPTIVMIMLFE